jgi:hypothetical protein
MRCRHERLRALQREHRGLGRDGAEPDRLEDAEEADLLAPAEQAPDGDALGTGPVELGQGGQDRRRAEEVVADPPGHPPVGDRPSREAPHADGVGGRLAVDQLGGHGGEPVVGAARREHGGLTDGLLLAPAEQVDRRSGSDGVEGDPAVEGQVELALARRFQREAGVVEVGDEHERADVRVAVAEQDVAGGVPGCGDRRELVGEGQAPRGRQVLHQRHGGQPDDRLGQRQAIARHPAGG